jgi:hypothetical protein
MKYVYLVYDDIHGLQYVCANKDKATEKVNNIAFNLYEVPKTDTPDYDDEDCYGFDGAAMWQRVEVE